MAGKILERYARWERAYATSRNPVGFPHMEVRGSFFSFQLVLPRGHHQRSLMRSPRTARTESETSPSPTRAGIVENYKIKRYAAPDSTVRVPGGGIMH